MLNEATKTAIVTEMAPPELALHLKLNADRYNTTAQTKWLVLSSVNWKLPSQPTSMWVHHVEQGEEHDQEDWNIYNCGRAAICKGKSKGKGRGLKGRGEDGHAGKGGFKGTCYRV